MSNPEPVQLDMIPFKERELQRGFVSSWLNSTPRYRFIAPNVQMVHNEWDLIAIRGSGFVDEIEIKLSRADFKRDFHKTEKWYLKKHERLAQGEGLQNYFSFLIPESLQPSIMDLLPEHAGLYIYKSGHAHEYIPAPRLHSKKRLTDKLRIQLGGKIMYRYWREVA